MQAISEKVGFLEHIVSEDGIETDPEKIEAATTWPVPECVRDLRSFIGLYSYYHHIDRGFAEVAAPLRALTGKYDVSNSRRNASLHLKN